MLVIGIDSHKDTLVGCLIDAAGRPLEHRSIANTALGHRELVNWAQGASVGRVAIEGSGGYGRAAALALGEAGAEVVEVPPQMTAAARRSQRSIANTALGHRELVNWAQGASVGRVAIEGSGGYGRAAALALGEAGAEVVEVPPQMTAAARRSQRTAAKSDPLDALLIARIGARDTDLPPPRPGGTLEELRWLAGYRRELVKSRTAHINRLHADLTQIRCGYHRTGAALTSAKGLQRVARLLAGDSAAPARVARGRLRQIRELNRQIADLAAEISELVSANGTTLTKIRGIGTIGAADILTEVGDPARFATKARFAMANGTAPLQASSGRTVRHRLNRGGNRQLNRAIHTAALTQIAQPNSEGRRLYQQHLDRGKTKREAIRALKRRISDRIWTHLQTDLRNTSPTLALT